MMRLSSKGTTTAATLAVSRHSMAVMMRRRYSDTTCQMSAAMLVSGESAVGGFMHRWTNSARA